MTLEWLSKNQQKRGKIPFVGEGGKDSEGVVMFECYVGVEENQELGEEDIERKSR
jgi:hypothetical protein